MIKGKEVCLQPGERAPFEVFVKLPTDLFAEVSSLIFVPAVEGGLMLIHRSSVSLPSRSVPPHKVMSTSSVNQRPYSWARQDHE